VSAWVLDDWHSVGATQLKHPCLADPEDAGCVLLGDPVGAAGLVVLKGAWGRSASEHWATPGHCGTRASGEGAATLTARVALAVNAAPLCPQP
jgi:hypothetical protein